MKPNLICFPFAGGSKYSYKHFLRETSLINIITVEYPGHGSRSNENLLKNMDAIVDDVYKQIKPYLNQHFAFFGHSMGTIVAYMLAKRLNLVGSSIPVHLFMSGRGGPSVKNMHFHRQSLSSLGFINTLKKMGGTYEEVLRDESLMELYKPILKADFEAIETFYYDNTNKLNVPLTVMYGKDDTPLNDVMAWQIETSEQINIVEFPGSHFFINNYASSVIEYITNILIKC